MQNYFPVIRNDCLPAVTKTGGGSIRPYVNYVTGLIACTIPRKSILSKITYACQKRGLNQETKGLNLTKHLAVSYRQNSKDSGRSIYDVYVSGNDSLGKLQAKFLNSHPKLLVKFLNRDYGFNITQKQLR